jgi:GMP synthase (glutamine-hydrolysing)
LHFSEVESIGEVKSAGTERYDKIILCGTALKDNVFRGQIDSFSWIKEFVGCILGICAGMQVIGSVFGGEIIPQADIGLKKIDIVRETPLLGEPRQIEGYHLHSYGVTLPDGFQLVAGKSDYVEAFKHQDRPIYGILFHPEVRNRWMVERFVQINPH